MGRTILYLDLETGDAERLWTSSPDFVRLAGLALGDGEVVVTTDIAAVVRIVMSADLVVGHNILGFDLPALERHHGLDLAKLVAENRVLDTLIIARQNDPPLAAGADKRRYNLDALCRRVLGDGKAGDGDESALKALSKEFGGFDRVPLDHPIYREYLVRDVELVREVSKHLVVDDYVWREHRAMWRLNHISKHGFRVDVELARRMVEEQASRIRLYKQRLHDTYGLPLEGKRPHQSAAGKVALEKAIVACGVEPPRTQKGNLATSQDALDALLARHPNNAEIESLCHTISAFNGERSTAQTLLDHVGADGRVHPSIGLDEDVTGQATGRISVTKPGLTVMGKRKRKNVLERALLLPDPGHVLVCADLSGIDARAMGIHSQDPAYIAALQPGKDVHDEMAAKIFGEDGWDRAAGHHPRRGDAKATTHATNYGEGAAKLASSTGVTLAEARALQAGLDAAFPKLAAFKTLAREEGRWQILENAYGRKMRVLPDQAYTKAPAAIGQGTARDLMVQGVLNLPEWLLPGLRAIVHDELVLSVPQDRAGEAEAAVLDALQFDYLIAPGALPVPILAEKSDRGRDWLDCYRSEKAAWPEVARDHRELPDCDEPECTWHRSNDTNDERENAA